MFTGIVEAVGRVSNRREQSGFFSLSIEEERIAGELVTGGSVAVAGVCLTVTEHGPTRFRVDVANETARRTTLDRRRAGDRVNLERPLAANGRVDGHFVQGHVDGRGEVVRVDQRGADRFLRIGHPAQSDRLIVEKGSIALDGVSLTVAGCGSGWFEVMLIPHTLRVTTLGELGPGDEVNLEYDILAKYLLRMASFTKQGREKG
jgi:riboflavin synthase